ncbi:hypothetical protein RHSIM_Rhsim09G0170700 [Rhododendron simsii]|uniref:Uncharacterized protein n=1 Tax=Rhododendron simsii TaxID=118357 RepID=A0A834LEE3_RHOSS|nr:hypothetical protein RHSIM_Rhsim09G0170700 [Rhododendron simsii]
MEKTLELFSIAWPQRMNNANEINMQIDPVKEQNMQIAPPNVSIVEMNEDAHASIEDQNMEIDPPIDEGISRLHESAHEVDKEKNVAKRVEMHVDAQVPIEEQNREASPPNQLRKRTSVRLAYAMTINKSQGQFVKFVGVELRTPVHQSTAAGDRTRAGVVTTREKGRQWNPCLSAFEQRATEFDVGGSQLSLDLDGELILLKSATYRDIDDVFFLGFRVCEPGRNVDNRGKLIALLNCIHERVGGDGGVMNPFIGRVWSLGGDGFSLKDCKLLLGDSTFLTPTENARFMEELCGCGEDNPLDLHQPERLMRQFGFRQEIPTDSKSMGQSHRQTMRNGQKDWGVEHANLIAVCDVNPGCHSHMQLQRGLGFSTWPNWRRFLRKDPPIHRVFEPPVGHGQADEVDEVLEQEGVAQQEGVAHDQQDPPPQHAEDPPLLEQPVPAHEERKRLGGENLEDIGLVTQLGKELEDECMGGQQVGAECESGEEEDDEAARTATPVEAHPRSKRVRRAKSCGIRTGQGWLGMPRSCGLVSASPPVGGIRIRHKVMDTLVDYAYPLSDVFANVKILYQPHPRLLWAGEDRSSSQKLPEAVDGSVVAVFSLDSRDFSLGSRGLSGLVFYYLEMWVGYFVDPIESGQVAAPEKSFHSGYTLHQ